MRWLCALVFALAAGSCALASSGMVVPPHVDPPGTPRFHDHLLAAYRFPLFLLRLKMLGQLPTGPGWSLETPGGIQLAALTLATLALLVPKLPRPTRRAIALLPSIQLAPSEWRAMIPLAPPRTSPVASFR
jgi:hypothetical protein